MHKGCGYIIYETQQNVIEAIREVNNARLRGNNRIIVAEFYDPLSNRKIKKKQFGRTPHSHPHGHTFQQQPGTSNYSVPSEDIQYQQQQQQPYQTQQQFNNSGGYCVRNELPPIPSASYSICMPRFQYDLQSNQLVLRMDFPFPNIQNALPAATNTTSTTTTLTTDTVTAAASPIGDNSESKDTKENASDAHNSSLTYAQSVSGVKKTEQDVGSSDRKRPSFTQPDGGGQANTRKSEFHPAVPDDKVTLIILLVNVVSGLKVAYRDVKSHLKTYHTIPRTNLCADSSRRIVITTRYRLLNMGVW